MNCLIKILGLSGLLFFTSCVKNVNLERELAHWEYEHPNWQEIGYQSCGGNAQSPIDIRTQNTVRSELLPALSFQYQPFTMKIVDNGHTIQVNPAQNNNRIIYNNVAYTLVQFHFHHHSEHQLNGAHTPLELHCVHQDDAGNLLVLTFMIEQGAASPFLESVFNAIPQEKKREVSTNVSLNILDILPANHAYYTYYGSLTTPPCSASVQFVVLKNHIQASAAQINRFAGIYAHNARPVQPLNNRLVFERP